MPRSSPGNEPPSVYDEDRKTLDVMVPDGVEGLVVYGPRGPEVYRHEGAEDPFRGFVDQLQEGALTLSSDGLILFANSHFATLVKSDVEHLVGVPLASFVPSHYHFTLASLIREGVEKSVRGQLRIELEHSTIPVQLTLGPLEGSGQPACCGVVSDLRERELSEEAHAVRLAAEQANAAKDQFLAILSHELRSPLNTMLGWAQILLNDGNLDERQQRAIQTIERSARTQAQLIADLLDISRIIAGKLELERSNLELAALAEAVLAAARPAIEQKQLAVSTHFGPDTDVYGDAARLEQAITNLFNNAFKFTEPGGKIELSVDLVEDAVVLRLADTGVGMAEDVVARIFDIFHQGEPQPRRPGGLGLGLAIAKQLVEAHGGTLTATSAGEGLGSTFILQLPRTAKSVPPPRPQFEPRGELFGMSALLIDDEEDSLELARYLLEAAGCKITAVDSAEQALAAIAENTFGLVISDIGLRDQDGLELMREIRARGHSAEALPAIALTGYAGVHDARLVEAAGFQRHLAKPVDATLLVKTAAEIGRKL